jgi:hypothetical protein
VLDAAGRSLRARLLDRFTRPFDEPLSDDAFDGLALEIFHFQFERNVPFGAFCRRRGRTPATVSHWSEVPAVPVAAFREVALVTGDVRNAEAVFRTSGTTRGAASRGTHYIPDLALYHGSLLPSFAARVLADGARPLMLSLLPPAAEMPDSSLAHMVHILIERLGAEGSVHCASVAGGIDSAALARALRSAEAAGTPVCLLGTSFSFVHWIDELRRAGERFRLPAGSRLMDTGGFKGRVREVPADELRAAYAQLLGLEPDLCVNEYGMTELCSQYYDSTLAERAARGVAGPRRKLEPPWARVRVVDPDTLQPLPHGQAGLLQHVDLANLGSVMTVQTEDLGRRTEDGFLVIGRAGTAEPRGCSIAMDDLLSAVRDRS